MGLADSLTKAGIRSAADVLSYLTRKGYTAMPAVRKIMANSPDIEEQKKLYKIIHRIGIDTVPGKNILSSALADLNVTGKQKIVIPKGDKPSAGVLAHRLGRVLNSRAARKRGGPIGGAAHMVGTRLLPYLSSVPAGLGQLLNVDTDTLAALGVGGVAMNIPSLVEETSAAMRGARLMKRFQIKGRGKAFATLPLQLLNTALPTVPWIGRKLQENFN